MTRDQSSEASPRPNRSLLQFRVWELWALSVFAAVAMVNIRDQGRHEPVLIAMAAAGFAAYGLLGWGAWHFARRLRPRLGRTTVLAVYLVAMAGLFMVATVAYLLLEHAYLVGI